MLSVKVRKNIMNIDFVKCLKFICIVCKTKKKIHILPTLIKQRNNNNMFGAMLSLLIRAFQMKYTLLGILI